jgi:hypothetical protein
MFKVTVLQMENIFDSELEHWIASRNKTNSLLRQKHKNII